jgi:hypothetical protein
LPILKRVAPVALVLAAIAAYFLSRLPAVAARDGA